MKIVELMVHITQTHVEMAAPYMGSDGVWLYPSGSGQYCRHTHSHSKLIYCNINLKFETQLVQILGFDFFAVLKNIKNI